MPNFPVDVNSWGKSACYPRSTFCPLSDGPSTQHHQIIKTCFRTCPRCRARSQAPFCLYTSYPDFRPGQGDLRAPPLPFGRRPPQSNRPPNAVRAPASWARVRNPVRQGWYFTDGSAHADAHASKPPSYPTHVRQNPSIRLR